MDMASAPKISSSDDSRNVITATMAKVVEGLDYEFHPLVNRTVCAFEVDGDFVHFDEHEIRNAAACAISGVMRDELAGLPDQRAATIEGACQRQLAIFVAEQSRNNWAI
ncbi:hypothetical protein [Erythrobacter aureus]|uniref:Uncharacterized protein n=1 Tax=Erythrobacter aureus TaxID=2182384 RepID=A0A345YIK1_9SPHN|nr:hypothetical protein [Erythrobacter aureus]AXK43753.1 hypothetical protein DVR09_14950 [Erythrobacter aureus]